MTLPKRTADALRPEAARGWSKVDRLSVTTAILGGGVALAIGAGVTAWERLLPYLLITMVVTLFAATVAWFARLAVFGKLTPNADELLRGRVRWLAPYWFGLKAGIVFASIYLFIAAGVSPVIGWPFGFLIEAAVFLALTILIGDMVVSCVLNIALIRSS